LVTGLGVASASIERSVEVAQPIVTEESMCIRNVTYITLSHESWGDAVDFTCDDNFVLISGWDHPVNRNAASLAGLKANVDVFHFQEQKLFGDTLRVVIDLSAMDASKVDFEPADIIHATLECVLINATRSMEGPEIVGRAPVALRHLRVDVRGSPEYANLSRTYRFKDLQKRKLEKACYGMD
jgi:hypothetical protein